MGFYLAISMLTTIAILTSVTRSVAEATDEPLSPATIVIHTIDSGGNHLPNVEYWVFDTNDKQKVHGFTDEMGTTDPFAIADGTYYFIAKQSPYYGWRKEPVSGFEDVYITLYKYQVGGFLLPVDKLALLTPQIGSVSTVLAITVLAGIYIKRVKHA